MQFEALKYDCTYHIFNRGNNREALFRQRHNYYYFLKLYKRHISPVADTYAYCLMPNHFHLLVYIKPKTAIETKRTPSQAFSNLFNAYAKSINKAYGRTGSLFETPFHRKIVNEDDYFKNLAVYIHRNPQHHGHVNDFQCWPFTSYEALSCDEVRPTNLVRQHVIDVFGGRDNLIKKHKIKSVVDSEFC